MTGVGISGTKAGSERLTWSASLFLVLSNIIIQLYTGLGEGMLGYSKCKTEKPEDAGRYFPRESHRRQRTDNVSLAEGWLASSGSCCRNRPQLQAPLPWPTFLSMSVLPPSPPKHCSGLSLLLWEGECTPILHSSEKYGLFQNLNYFIEASWIFFTELTDQNPICSFRCGKK